MEFAIVARDVTKFAAALTQNCNACHLSRNRPALVIRVPAGNPYADQDLAPVMK
jgi:hypothetical protein